MKKQANTTLQKRPQPQRALPNVASLIPFVNMNEHDAFVDKKGCIIDILQIPCKDMNAAKEYDVLFDMYNWIWLYKRHEDDIKLISMNYPVDTFNQVKQLDAIISRTKNPVFVRELEKEKFWLEHAHAEYAAQEYYLMFFSEDVRSYKRNRNQLQSCLKAQIKNLRLGKKLQILGKLNNMNSELSATPETSKIPRSVPNGVKYNPYLISAIQPRGGASFRDERYIKKGDGYETCIRVYKCPSHVNFNWLAQFSGYENTIATFDIGKIDKMKTVDDISKSLEEQQSRFYDARHQTEKFEAKRVYAQLERLHDEIVSVGEVVKRLSIRLFIYAKTVTELEETTGKILGEIESKGFKAAVMLDECKYDWQSMFLSITQQDGLRNARAGMPIPSETLALGHPYHFSALADEFGTYWGHTQTGGTVLFDPYLKDKQRLSYCMIVLGLMGSGKSTALKFRMKKDAIQGNYIRGFATNNEFAQLVRYLGGSIINLDGSDGFLNVLHIYKTDENEAASFVKHLDKVCKWYTFLVPEASSYDIFALQEVLRELYQEHMGYNLIHEQKNKGNTKITGRDPKEYPILDDLMSFLRRKMFTSVEKRDRRKGVSDEYFSIYEKLEMALSSTINSLGNIFNGHSSIREFEKEQIVFFSVAGLLKLKGTIFDAQVFSAMSLLWDNMLAVGGPQKDLFDQGAITMSEIKKYVIYMDECHNFANAKKLEAVRILDHYTRESRKFFGGLILATHKITDFFPSHSTADGIEAMENLFSLAQYKMLFQQSPDSLTYIKKVMGDDLPGNDLEQLAKFVQGECILNITGVNSVRLHLDVDEEELRRFSGGA